MHIQQILIKDSPSFENLDLCFHQGLNVISGSSGAGKSVFFASLLALFGHKESNASVIEGFLEGDIELFEYLSEEELNIQILKKEKTRYFINHQSTSKKRLSEIFSPYAKFLSHKNSNELESAFLLTLLDDMIADPHHHQNLKLYQEQFLYSQALQAQLQRLREDAQRLVELKEFARFEIERISSINPRAGEYEELLEYKKMLSKREKLQSLGAEALVALEQARKISVFLEALEERVEGFDEMILELDAKVESEMQKLAELEEQNPEEVLDRLSKLSSLISRYGGIDEALEYLEEQKNKLASYETIEDNQKELESQLNQIQKTLQELACSLSEKRSQHLRLFEEEIKQYASLLLLSCVNFSLQESAMHQLGRDYLEVRLGSSLVHTLSSGEYNRLRLAILALQNKKNMGILLLDEIDANLSGEESEGVAKVLKKLSLSYQVFAISHQPHLPSVANAHFVVQKTNEGSKMQELDREGRIREIARMISGAHLTQEALEFARKKVEAQ
ncbi:DNA recombination protein RecN [Helicobacter kayseriensis]|uniref:DNA recombination protein RecN n=1 Tax=Helicobacter kayseriensis TaxID=2905877 RepID=UPI001E47B40D|nr:DNA recombination protein RecN [Helicobacter kayseriensis]MCE3047051.1 DNA recombination protein RecN [Helicobacter kayseriensis]MCE3048289.1 DNA recombination protein RecN [Helicobacter kayseriensis]